MRTKYLNIQAVPKCPLLFYLFQSYIACAWGISQVGHVTICYGVVSAVMDCSSGFLVKYLTRMPVFIMAAASHFLMFVTLLLWSPNSTNYSLYFILSGVYGIGASVWWSQIIGACFEFCYIIREVQSVFYYFM